MALTPETLQAIQEAYERAVQTINTPTEVYLDIPENKKIVQDFMLSEGLTQQAWNEFVWGASIAECRKRGFLWTRPAPKTREQIEKEHNARLTADGNRVGNSHGHYSPRAKATQEEIAAAKQSLRDVMDPIGSARRRAAEKAAAETNTAKEQRTLLESIPVEIPFEQYDKAQRAAFKKLTADNIRLVNARHREYMRANPPVERETE